MFLRCYSLLKCFIILTLGDALELKISMAAKVLAHFNKPWKILVSVCLTRMSITSKELSDIQQRYAAMQNEIEFERSVLNDYEYRKIQLRRLDEKKHMKLSEDDETEVLEATRELAALQVIYTSIMYLRLL